MADYCCTFNVLWEFIPHMTDYIGKSWFTLSKFLEGTDSELKAKVNSLKNVVQILQKFEFTWDYRNFDCSNQP
jgi:hypothetical protein